MQNEPVKHVSWFRLFWKHMLWLPILVILFGGGVMYGSWFFGRDRARLDRDGFETTATITRLEGRVPQHGQQSSRHLYVHYSFHPGPGKFATGRSSVSTETFRGLRVGQTINIRAVSELPFISEYEHSTLPNHIFWGYLIGGGMIVIGLFTGPKLFSEFYPLRRATESGFAETAEVIQRPENARASSQCVFWRTAGGVEGSSLKLYPQERPEAGETISVVVDTLTGNSYWVKEL